jgi:hypothetical protein
MMAKTPPQFTIKPESLFHGYPPGQIHVPVSKGRIGAYDLFGQSEENAYPLMRDFPYTGINRFHCHDDLTPEAYGMGHLFI